MVAVPHQLLHFCSRCLLFSGANKGTALSWDMALVRREKTKESAEQCDASKCLLGPGTLSPQRTFSRAQTGHMAKPDNVADETTPPTERHECPGNGLGCGITGWGEPMPGPDNPSYGADIRQRHEEGEALVTRLSHHLSRP